MSLAIIDSAEDLETLAKLADERGLDAEKLTELLAAVASHSGMLRRRGLFQRFDAILDPAALSGRTLK